MDQLQLDSQPANLVLPGRRALVYDHDLYDLVEQFSKAGFYPAQALDKDDLLNPWFFPTNTKGRTQSDNNSDK